MCIKSRLKLRFEEFGVAFAQQRRLIPLNAQAGALAQPEHGTCMIADKLPDSLVSCLAFMLAAEVCVQVVRIDVKGHQSQGLEGGRLHDGHVVGGVYGACGHIGAGTAAHVGEALLQHQLADQFDQLQFVQFLQQHKRIAAADENGLRLAERPPLIGFCMQPLHRIAPRLQSSTDGCRIFIMVPQGVRNKEHGLHVLAAGIKSSDEPNSR